MPLLNIFLHYGISVEAREDRMETTFFFINDTGEDIFCHWIAKGGNDGESGVIVVRDGDRVPPAARGTLSRGSHLCRVEQGLEGHFCHKSEVSHAFAICRAEGGPPSVVYQQRRAFGRFTTNTPGDPNRFVRHMHAVRIISLELPLVQEVFANEIIQQHDHGPFPWTVHYELVDPNNHRENLMMASTLMGTKVPLPSAWPDDRYNLSDLMRCVLGLRSLPVPSACPLAYAYGAISKIGEIMYGRIWRTLDRVPM